MHRFQKGLWDDVKVLVLVQCPENFEAAAEIAAHIGTILANTPYGKGSKKPKNKGRNPYYLPYHRDDVVGGDAGPVPMELGKTMPKCWTCRSLHY